jgi:hypothetical protein
MGLIEENWDDLLCLAASIKFGHATASLIVGKLSAASRWGIPDRRRRISADPNEERADGGGKAPSGGSSAALARTPSAPAVNLYGCAERCPGVTSMADADDVRHLALALPHVAEIESAGFDFRVAGKGFVWSYPERRPGRPRLIRTDIAVLYVGDEAEKQALLLGEPEVFFTTPAYDGLPLVMLWLARVNVARLSELVTDAWRMRAPDVLVGDLDGADPASPGPD